MGDHKNSGWDRVFDELKNPWDWAAAAIGGAGGTIATIILHGVDLGHSIPAGALLAIGARKAGVASLRRRALENRADELLLILVDANYADLVATLDGERKKWKRKVTTNDKFEDSINKISEEHSRRIWPRTRS